MQSLSRIAVVIIQIQPGGEFEETVCLIMLAELTGENGVNGRGQRGFMNTARLIIFIIGQLGFPAELAVIQEHKHQHIRLLNHVVTVQPVIGPV
ncbi:hypothetical protein D3C76_1283510 [compost metagenome]